MGTISTPPLADVLFNKAQQRLLALLVGNPERTFYSNELIELAGCGTGAVQRELARLAAVGLLTVSQRGNQKHFQVNTSAPIYPELRGLVVKTFGLADVLKLALTPLAGEIQAAFIYGSIARQQDTASSDVDLMVISETLTHADLFGSLEPAAQALGRTVNPTIYSPAELEKRLHDRNAFVTRVMAQPKIWILGAEDALAA
jgi:predicted nucleotidyltransferase